MKLDINLAWQQASTAIKANREVLLALAGVFFLLPRLAVELLVPAPPTAGAGGQAAWVAAMQLYYVQVLPFMVPMMLIEATGTLTMLALFTDRTRPTVGQAIGQGAKSVLPYLASQLLFAFGVGIAGGLVLQLAATSGIGGLPQLAVVIVAVAALCGFLRLVLVAPVMAVEHLRRPLAAMRRSLQLTRGNLGRIALFLGLLMLALVVSMYALISIAGSGMAMLAGPKPAQITAAAISASLSAVFAVYLAGILIAIHRQLAGPSASIIQTTFE